MTSTAPAERAPVQGFFGLAAVVFAASTALTIAWCTAMADAGGMPMPGDWTMSMAWMRMPGQTWADAVASFVRMWTAMMMAMMLPSLLPSLWRYRQTVAHTGNTRADRLAIVVAAGYFSIWTLFGFAAFWLGVDVAAVEMRQPSLARAVPLAIGVVVLLAGLLQFSSWKRRRLACCRETAATGAAAPVGVWSAWRHGLRLGYQCGRCCANLMMIWLVIGVMDLRAMTVVTAALTAERLVPTADRAAQAIGILIVAAAIVLLARGAGLDFV